MEVQEEVVTNMESNSMENHHHHHHLPDHEYGSSPSSVTENNRTDDQNLQEELGQIVKGKRTKRQRPQSPIPFRLSPSSSSSAESSPAEEATTEEEKDMANCLILLAQGVHARRPQPSHRRPDPGLCVYECKTCSRTFPSFQALGGHRASHKKPKLAAAADDRKNYQTFVLSDEEGQQQQFKRINHHPPLSLAQLDGNRSNKLHECSICGAEFMSGQALGGHMRRHRGPVMAAAAPANTTLTLSPMAEAEEEKPRGGGLSLDLNLPATAEDENHNRESKFALASKQQQEEKQQAHLVFSTPTLVDCHY